MPKSVRSCFALVVDTEQFAGNFERELCAYATAQIGDCQVGHDLAMGAEVELQHLDWWAEHIVQVSNPEGTGRPVRTWATPGWFNHGMGVHYRDLPEIEAAALQDFQTRIVEYQGHLSDRDKALTKYPAYLSVAIFVDQLPPREVWDEFQQRVLQFAREHKQFGGEPDPLQVTGFRQLLPEEVLKGWR